MTTAAMKETRNAELIKVMEELPVVINDRNKELEEISGLVEFANPEKGLACCFNTKYYSLNACKQDKLSRLHCTTISIGGVLWGAYPDSEQLKRYNDDCLFEGGKIKCVHMADGTKVYPAV